MKRLLVRYDLSPDMKQLLSYEKRPLNVFRGNRQGEKDAIAELDRLSAGMETACETKRSPLRKYLKDNNHIVVYDVVISGTKRPKEMEIRDMYPVTAKSCVTCSKSNCRRCASEAVREEPDPIWIPVMRHTSESPLKKRALKAKTL